MDSGVGSTVGAHRCACMLLSICLAVNASKSMGGDVSNARTLLGRPTVYVDLESKGTYCIRLDKHIEIHARFLPPSQKSASRSGTLCTASRMCEKECPEIQNHTQLPITSENCKILRLQSNNLEAQCLGPVLVLEHPILE